MSRDTPRRRLQRALGRHWRVGPAYHGDHEVDHVGGCSFSVAADTIEAADVQTIVDAMRLHQAKSDADRLNALADEWRLAAIMQGDEEDYAGERADLIARVAAWDARMRLAP